MCWGRCGPVDRIGGPPRTARPFPLRGSPVRVNQLRGCSAGRCFVGSAERGQGSGTGHDNHTLRRPTMHTRLRGRGAVLLVASLTLLGLGSPQAGAVNADLGTSVVSANPGDLTPHVMNGSVDAITQIGNKIIAAGTFTSVSPRGHVRQHLRRRGPQPDLRVRRHHRCDRPRLQPEPRRRGALARHRRHLHLRRWVVRLGGRRPGDQAVGQAERRRLGGAPASRRSRTPASTRSSCAAPASTSAAGSPASGRGRSPPRAGPWPAWTARRAPCSPG